MFLQIDENESQVCVCVCVCVCVYYPFANNCFSLFSLRKKKNVLIRDKQKTMFNSIENELT